MILPFLVVICIFDLDVIFEERIVYASPLLPHPLCCRYNINGVQIIQRQHGDIPSSSSSDLVCLVDGMLIELDGTGDGSPIARQVPGFSLPCTSTSTTSSIPSSAMASSSSSSDITLWGRDFLVGCSYTSSLGFLVGTGLRLDLRGSVALFGVTIVYADTKIRGDRHLLVHQPHLLILE
jgi:hypothetical protein